MKLLPPARSKSWVLLMIVYSILLWLIFCLNRFVQMERPADAGLMLRLALLALGLSAVVHLLGWLGLRLFWLVSTACTFAGLALMFFSTYRDMSGWEDLAGFLFFVLLTLGGFTLGLIVEGVYRLLQRQHPY
ncbi:hypothetical protein [Paenibacillus donghaensis]|uniref:Uncharacterized protein n=1 Tax=Paenibacillus donghaensis TaxID=414771 RepID=A0A2Z2KA27_9BACL|nr:hypothetical protein [Paenibacillus donghaensis]ASA19633.1 hypothetical protein B9T62_01640 [Paenibacillus donghaensis]